jgi:hypothetical protein
VVDDITSKASDFAARATSTARDAGEKIYSAGNQAAKYAGETVAFLAIRWFLRTE